MPINYQRDSFASGGFSASQCRLHDQEEPLTLRARAGPLRGDRHCRCGAAQGGRRRCHDVSSLRGEADALAHLTDRDERSCIHGLPFSREPVSSPPSLPGSCELACQMWTTASGHVNVHLWESRPRFPFSAITVRMTPVPRLLHQGLHKDGECGLDMEKARMRPMPPGLPLRSGLVGRDRSQMPAPMSVPARTSPAPKRRM